MQPPHQRSAVAGSDLWISVSSVAVGSAGVKFSFYKWSSASLSPNLAGFGYSLKCVAGTSFPDGGSRSSSPSLLGGVGDRSRGDLGFEPGLVGNINTLPLLFASNGGVDLRCRRRLVLRENAVGHPAATQRRLARHSFSGASGDPAMVRARHGEQLRKRRRDVCPELPGVLQRFA